MKLKSKVENNNCFSLRFAIISNPYCIVIGGMPQDFLDKLGGLQRYLRKYKKNEIDDRWREYLRDFTVIKVHSREVCSSTSALITEEKPKANPGN